MCVSNPLFFLLADNGSSWALTRARIGMRTLTTTWQAATVTKTPVTSDVHQALDVGNYFSAKITFDLIVRFKLLAEGVDIISGQIVAVFSPIDTGGIKDFESCSSADAINICQCDI